MQEVDNATDSVRNHNVGNSDYAKHKIQPWDVWIEFQLNPFDADLAKRTLRTKAEGGMTKNEARKLDYEKIVHIASERIRQIKTGVTWPVAVLKPTGARVDEIVDEYKLCSKDAMILDNILMKDTTDGGRIKQYEAVIRYAKKRIEELNPLIAEEKEQEKYTKMWPDKRDIIIEKAARTIHACLKKISSKQSTYKQITQSMESLLNEIASKDQLDLFNN